MFRKYYDNKVMKLKTNQKLRFEQLCLQESRQIFASHLDEL